MAKRFVLEGEWTGYRSSQARISHREIITEKRADFFRRLHKIVFTDGTALILFVRPAVPRENVVPLRGYSDLIHDAERVLRASNDPSKSVVTVAETLELDAVTA